MVTRTTAMLAKTRLAKILSGNSERSEEDTLEPLRERFWNGQYIPAHRALRRLTPRQSDVLSMLAIPLLANALMWVYWEDLSLFAMGVMFFFLHPLIDTLTFAAHDMPGLNAALNIPRIHSMQPDPGQWWIGFAASAGCLFVASLPMKSLIGLRYFLGFFGAMQLASQLYFSIGRGALTVNPQDYLVDSMQLSLYWIFFTPWLLGLTFNLFPFSQLHKIRLTALAVCHQFMLFPVQFALQAIVLHQGSALWGATLFFAMGLPFNIMTTLCFYSLGMAWPGIERERE
jgi:hypothetical protein